MGLQYLGNKALEYGLQIKHRISRIFKRAIEYDKLPGFFNILGIITLPVPIVFSLITTHLMHITPTTPIFGNFGALSFPGAWLLGDILVILAIWRFHPAMVRRMGLIAEAFTYGTRFYIGNPINSIDACNEAPSILRHFINSIKNLSIYLLDCPNRIFFMRVASISAPIMMVYFVSIPGLPGHFPVFQDLTQFGTTSIFFFGFQIYAALHFSNAAVERSCLWLDALTLDKNIFLWTGELVQSLICCKTPEYRSWRNDFFKKRKEYIQRANPYKMIGNGVGLIFFSILSATIIPLGYFDSIASGVKTPALGEIALLGNHIVLLEGALFFFTITACQRAGEYVGAWRFKKEQTRYRALAIRTIVPPYLIAGFIMSLPFLENENLNQADFLTDIWALPFPIRLLLLELTADNFSVPFGQNSIGPMGDYWISPSRTEHNENNENEPIHVDAARTFLPLHESYQVDDRYGTFATADIVLDMSSPIPGLYRLIT